MRRARERSHGNQQGRQADEQLRDDAVIMIADRQRGVYTSGPQRYRVRLGVGNFMYAEGTIKHNVKRNWATALRGSQPKENCEKGAYVHAHLEGSCRLGGEERRSLEFDEEGYRGNIQQGT